ncbi:MAG: DUF1501 domain-containing protein, partial [Pseudomonadales bacterium]|nr:DUF1501 domain-containing protein [Pseudomonadales bacterium]
MLAFELDSQRREDHIYPTFLSMDYRPKEPGVFENRFGGFYVTGSLGTGLFSHPHGESVFQKRFNALYDMDPLKRKSDVGDPDAVSYLWSQAGRLMGDSRVIEAFTLSNETLSRYGNASISRQLAQSYQVLRQDLGARFINVGYESWDDHGNIYLGHRNKMRPLDSALAALLDDLSLTPGVEEGRSLLDETLIIVAGEFGRTPGPLNGDKGRDHYGAAFAGLVAGGGIQGGRLIGATDEGGTQITDIGWQMDRPISTTDLSATVLSAMGIDAGSAILPIAPLAGMDCYDSVPPGAGITSCIGTVAGRKCLIIANNPAVKGGTYFPLTVKKHLRAQEIA